MTELSTDLTAVSVEVSEGVIAFVEELPGVNTQGATLDEAKANLREAVQLVLVANRELAAQDVGGRIFCKEPLNLASP